MNYTLTFHYPKNYGAFLQCFSLQMVLDDSIVLNFIPHWSFFAGKKYPYFIRWGIGSWRRKKLMAKFEERNRIKTSKRISSTEEASFVQSDDCLIVGSDQVWNPRFIYDELVYFGDMPNDIKRISYAVSLGMTAWPKDFENKVLPLLRKFSAISVREESSVKYLTSLGLKNVVCVCDPTILHKADFYRREFQINKQDLSKPFVYVIREKLPMQLQEIIPNDYNAVYLGKDNTLVSVKQWLSNIDSASFVVTDSFHCVVFCLLFHKPFLVIPNSAKGVGMNERFATLLGKIHLEYRCVSPEDTSTGLLKKLNTAINWESVDQILEEWRRFSLNWLKKSLEN
ncbi:MAG: polysaccharide pyruvyl transferase family protein [Fibrobacter sp.]|nr:polysaccharide pyruvyl transferase family protein [Fibrobacter sp.]